jgi:D-glycero-alpha-D-manno-heptose-7-phosphate kinase
MQHTLIRARAPLRLGLGGGGTDVAPYCDEHGGIVLNATINRYAHVTIERLDGDVVELIAADQKVSWRGGASDALPLVGPLRLLAGVYRRFSEDYRGGQRVGLRITTHADSPPGSGLGTSSALVVAMVEAMRFALDLPLDVYDIARLAYRIERSDLNLNGGKQDQYAAAFGGVNYMEFHAGDRVLINPLRIDRRTLAELESSMVIHFTGVSRESAAIIDEQSKNMREGSASSLAALHQLKDDAQEMKEALLLGRIDRLAELLNRSWDAKKRTAGGISSAAIEETYERAMRAGAIGGKVSGAGGGGFMMFICDPARRPELLSALRESGGDSGACHFSSRGAEAWRIR